MSKLYKKSGVDVIKTDKLIGQALKFIKSSHSDKVLGNKLGFSAEYKVNKDVTLCAATDGVGTKAILAAELKEYKGLGQDLVAMCSNDLLCNKAKPLFFLDYFACSSVKSKQYTQILKSINSACKKINCSLIGGETAEMPSLYRGNHFDIAGFLVGIKENHKNLKISKGDLIFGIKSNGFHSNGYSLIRDIIKKNKIDIKRAIFNKQKLSKLIMKPTRLYHQLISNNDLRYIKTLSHITGGGIYSNFKRSIPKGTKFDFKITSLPREYDFIKDNINITDIELTEIFNCGIGMIFIINKKYYSKFI
ncbi:phosphoribosylformylglycinamidine cyclo-ligase [Alphaproteobacteria bacterium]|nr:phosphoribosylformylglycinamidine cyclo-ligase [Alphaproteobacteria bacterium]